jgi:YHS domain-containing protein
MARLLVLSLLLLAQAPAPRSAKEALQPFNDLIGSWRCTCNPGGSREEQQKNFWVETLAVEWQFKGPAAWLKLDFTKGKHLSRGELRPKGEGYELELRTTDKKTLTFAGTLKERVLTLERTEGDAVQRLVFTFLHANRFLYRVETRPAGKTLFALDWKVGATKEGEAFATGDGRPECVVSGGRGTMAVSYQGKTYYVCCSGCRDEFNDSPAKYVAEYEAKKAKKKN